MEAYILKKKKKKTKPDLNYFNVNCNFCHIDVMCNFYHFHNGHSHQINVIKKIK